MDIKILNETDIDNLTVKGCDEVIRESYRLMDAYKAMVLDVVKQKAKLLGKKVYEHKAVYECEVLDYIIAEDDKDLRVSEAEHYDVELLDSVGDFPLEVNLFEG